jgi:hypothetical protein
MNVWKILQAKVLTNTVAPATAPSCPGSRTPSWFWYIFCLSRLWGVFEDEGGRVLKKVDKKIAS